MAPHSSTLAWKIPWTEESGRLQSMGLRRVRHDWATSLSLFTFMLWIRKWQPTPVCLPGESQGRGSLVGCRLWGRTESDTTESTEQQQQLPQEGEPKCTAQITIAQDSLSPCLDKPSVLTDSKDQEAQERLTPSEWSFRVDVIHLDSVLPGTSWLWPREGPSAG